MNKGNCPETRDDFLDLESEIDQLLKAEAQIRSIRQEKQHEERAQLYRTLIESRASESSDSSTNHTGAWTVGLVTYL